MRINCQSKTVDFSSLLSYSLPRDPLGVSSKIFDTSILAILVSLLRRLNRFYRISISRRSAFYLTFVLLSPPNIRLQSLGFKTKSTPFQRLMFFIIFLFFTVTSRLLSESTGVYRLQRIIRRKAAYDPSNASTTCGFNYLRRSLPGAECRVWRELCNYCAVIVAKNDGCLNAWSVSTKVARKRGQFHDSRRRDSSTRL